MLLSRLKSLEFNETKLDNNYNVKKKIKPTKSELANKLWQQMIARQMADS